MVQVVGPAVEILEEDLSNVLQDIEVAARTCYKSAPGTQANTLTFIKMLVDRGHESVFEHVKITVKFICDRGVSHELVRHRLASYSQESTRYCNYSENKFGNSISVIDISGGMFMDTPKDADERSIDNDLAIKTLWFKAMEAAEAVYLKMIDLGAAPQIARSVLPNSLKTEIIMTANIRQWRTVFKQRTAAAAHPQMREVMIPLLLMFREQIPILFDDIKHAHEKE